MSPWLDQLCGWTSITWKGKTVPCNPPGGTPASVSGACSGFPFQNDVNTIVLDNPKAQHRLSCNSTTPTVMYMNTQNVTSVNSSAMMFNDPVNYDFGVDNRNSPLYSMFPGFTSCPVSKVGPQNPAIIQPITINSKHFTRAIRKSLARKYPW